MSELMGENFFRKLGEFNTAYVQMQYKQEKGIPQDQALDYKDRLAVAIRVAKKPVRGDVESQGFVDDVCRLAFGYVFRQGEDYSQYFGDDKNRCTQVMENISNGLLRISEQSAERLNGEYRNREDTDQGNEDRNWGLAV